MLQRKRRRMQDWGELQLAHSSIDPTLPATVSAAQAPPAAAAGGRPVGSVHGRVRVKEEPPVSEKGANQLHKRSRQLERSSQKGGEHALETEAQDGTPDTASDEQLATELRTRIAELKLELGRVRQQLVEVERARVLERERHRGVGARQRAESA